MVMPFQAGNDLYFPDTTPPGEGVPGLLIGRDFSFFL
jgi:hypothetical protein